MPTRYLKPGVRDSDSIESLSALAETLFYRLLVTVDDFGRYDGRPAMVKAHCFPIKDISSAKVSGLLDELAFAGLLIIYMVDGKPYVQMCKWDNAPRAKDSKFPACVDECAQTYTDACKPRTLLPGTGTGTGTETETETDKTPRKRSAPPFFELPDWINREHWDAWHSCPKRRKATAEQKALAVSKLETWRKAGQDHAGALENAAVGGWQGLFLPDAQKAGNQSFAQQAADVARSTVPAKPGRDPALVEYDRDAAKAAPIPQAIREKMAALRGAA